MPKDPYRTFAKWYDTLLEPLNSGLRSIGMKMYPAYPGMDVLDIGCGTGAHLQRYQQENCNIFGIDLSQAMLEVAQDKLGQDADLRLCDATSTDFADDQFDLILLMTVLHEMGPGTRLKVCQEAKRLVKPKGRILVIDFHPTHVHGFRGAYSKSMIIIAELLAGRKHFAHYRHFIQNGGLTDLIQSTGFKIEDQKFVSAGNFELSLLRK